jgi:hypothetical protein
MRSTAAYRRPLRDPKRWPSRVEASTLLLSLEALARWREHLALTMEDAAAEPWPWRELPDLGNSPATRRGLH